RPPRPLAVTGVVVLVSGAIGLFAAAIGIPLIRAMFSTRVPLEVAGLLASWGLIARIPEASVGRPTLRALRVGVAVLALGWGAWQTLRGNAEARQTVAGRGLP